MIDGELCFSVLTKYGRTQHNPLMRLAVAHPLYEPDLVLYRWVFKFSDLPRVEELLGTVCIPDIRDKFDVEDADVPQFKGKDRVSIEEFPKIYRVIEHRKQESGKVKDIPHTLPKAIVDTIWENIILKQPLNKPIHTRTVSENICNLLLIDRFTRLSSGTFDYTKFYGDRTAYYTYFYLPIKVLAFKGLVEHHRAGLVERLSDTQIVPKQQTLEGYHESNN